MVHGIVRGAPPAIDLADERALQQLIALLAAGSLLRSAHDCSDGGLAVTLAECAFDSGGIGCDLTLPAARPARAVWRRRSLRGGVADFVSAREAGRRPRGGAAAAAGGAGPRPGADRRRAVRFAIEGAPDAPVGVPLAEAERAWSTGLSRHFEETAA